MIGGAPLREQIADVMWVYAVDAALAPVGLLAAIAGPESGYAVLMLLPLLGLLRLFAAEQHQRLDNLSELERRLPRHRARAGGRGGGRQHLHGGALQGTSWSSRSPSRPRWASTPAGAATSSSAPSCTTSARSPIPKEIINKTGPLDDGRWGSSAPHTHRGPPDARTPSAA